MKVCIAGCGNAAWHFVRLLRRAGHDVPVAWGRNSDKLRAFCQANNLRAIPSPADSGCDVVVLAVSDDAVPTVAAMVPEGPLVAHVSGSLPGDILPQAHSGVIWPMQSLTAGHTLDYSGVPFCVEGSEPGTADTLRDMLTPLGCPVQVTTTAQRMQMHLAAVFACNFSNHLYRIAEHLSGEAGLPFELMHPLILHTARKIQVMPPAMAQTGPARRKDTRTLMRHLELLRDEPELSNLYRIFTQLIQDRTTHDHQL